MKRGRRSQNSADNDGSATDGAEKFDGEESDSQESLHGDGEHVEEGFTLVNSVPPPPRARVSAPENAAGNATEAEISEMADDIMAISGNEVREGDNDDEENSRGSASPTNSLSGITIDRGAFVDREFPEYFRRDVEKVSRFLRNLETQKCDIPEKTYRDRHATLTVPPRHVRTLDGVAKCLQLIPETSMSKYTQPYEGFPWVFMSRYFFNDLNKQDFLYVTRGVAGALAWGFLRISCEFSFFSIDFSATSA